MGGRVTAVAAVLILSTSQVARPDPGSPYGQLGRPAFALHDPAPLPAQDWVPQPGDVILTSSRRPRAYLMYALARTGPPAHAGLVVLLPDGRPGVVEAGGDGDLMSTRLVPLADRLGRYEAEVWVRRRAVPLTDEQSCRLTAFALAADGGRYALGRAIGLGAGVGARGPLRTGRVGLPRGGRKCFFCGELVIEALVYAGALDPTTARPSAVFPRDLFFDTSANPYLRRHPPLGCEWEPPARWVGCGCLHAIR